MPRVNKTLSYLAIGGLASRDGARANHGRKIRQAMDNRAGGCPVRIISEENWASVLHLT